MDTNNSSLNQEVKEIIELKGVKVWRRKDGITQIQIQDRDTLGVSDVVEIVSTIYQLNLNQEGSILLIQAQKNSRITKEARFLISRCSHILAAALITRKSISERIIHRLFGISQKDYPFKSFTSSKSGISWLSRYTSLA